MVSRRSVITSLMGLPMIVRGTQHLDYDAIIVGAGVAGIAAGRILQGRGLRPLILEARERVGGRAHTCRSPQGIPFDLGALWFHSAERNPLAQIAISKQVELEPSNFEDIELRRNGVPSKQNIRDQLVRGERRVRWRALPHVLFGADKPLSDFAVDPASSLAVEAEALQCAASAATLSIIDISTLEGGANVIPKGGMGTFVNSLGQGLPVRLNCCVERIDLLGAGGVRVQGSFGSMTARTCVLTLPTSLIAGGSIDFTPTLPRPFLEHFADLPMGLMLKIGLGLTEPIVGAKEFTIVSTSGDSVVRIDQVRRFATVITSGTTAANVSAGGAADKAEFARDLLKEIFGSSVPIVAESDISSAWDADPFSRGSYAHAVPGRHAARKVYEMDVDQQLFFAGEAGGREYAMTVAGAWLSGERAAHKVISALRA
jgi:monoamine oxidase